MGVSKELIGKFLIENLVDVKLHILSSEISKQSLWVKSSKAKIRAEKAKKLLTRTLFLIKTC